MNRFLFLISIGMVAFGLAPISYGQVPRTDRVECVFPEGSLVELSSEFVQMRPQLGPSPSRTNQTSLTMQLKPIHASGSFKLEYELDSAGGVPKGEASARKYANKLCYDFQVFGKYMTIGEVGGAALLTNGKTIDFLRDYSKQSFKSTVSKRTLEDLAHLEKFGERTIGLMYADAILSNGIYITEQSLTDAEAKKYFGVFRSYSRDQGKTWTFGHVSVDPWLWDLSRDLEDQCFHGRARRVNAYVFEPVFPACAKPFDPNRSVPSAVWQLQ
jgi:hypothetical protein